MHSAIYADTLLRSVALSVARNEVGARRPLTEIIASEGITAAEYDQISKNPQFKRYYTQYCKDLSENGFSFEAKSKVLAEDLLPIAYAMARDPDVPAPVRAKMIENIVDWGNLKPKQGQLAVTGSSGFSISINFPDSAPKAEVKDVIDAEDAEIIEETAEIGLEVPSLGLLAQENVENGQNKAQKSAVMEALESIFDEPDEYAGEDICE
jgi:hypothetical protein